MEAEVEEHESVAVPLVVRLVEDIDPQLRPDGEFFVRTTGPVSPLRKDMVIVDVADEPTLRADGVVEAMVKSGGTPKVNDVVVE